MEEEWTNLSDFGATTAVIDCNEYELVEDTFRSIPSEQLLDVFGYREHDIYKPLTVYSTKFRTNQMNKLCQLELLEVDQKNDDNQYIGKKIEMKLIIESSYQLYNLTIPVSSLRISSCGGQLILLERNLPHTKDIPSKTFTFATIPCSFARLTKGWTQTFQIVFGFGIHNVVLPPTIFNFISPSYYPPINEDKDFLCQLRKIDLSTTILPPPLQEGTNDNNGHLNIQKIVTNFLETMNLKIINEILDKFNEPSDIQFICDGFVFNCHKKVFIRQGVSVEATIAILDISLSIFLDLIRFLYEDSIPTVRVAAQHLLNVLETSFNLPALKDRCEKFLASNSKTLISI